ncbi:MAG: MarR family transcriptional regulator [Acidimicrobiia bacterium]|nr:MarR family transcriptional regulator [Acidimicrobiia bacterium]
MRALLDLQIPRDLAQDSGLSDADYTVLVVLSEAPGDRVRMMELAERMLWSRSRVSHHLQRMEERGLVRREEHADNVRAIDAVLTEKGVAAAEVAAPKHVASVRRHLVDLLTEDELRALGDMSERVIAHLWSVEPEG